MLVGGDARTGVAHLDTDSLPVALDADHHLAEAGELHRVGGQVGQHLAHPHRVPAAVALRVVLDRDREAQLLLARRVAERLAGRAHQGLELEVAELHLHLARLDPGKVEDAVQDPQQGLAGFMDQLDAVAPRRIGIVAEQDLRHAQDAVQRRADLVAHVGQEVALGPVGALRLHPRHHQRRFAPADLRGHVVERLAERGDLVAALHRDLGRLAPFEPLGGVLEPRDRSGHLPGEGGGAQRRGQEAHAGERQQQGQQRPVGRERGRERIAQQQRGVFVAQHMQRPHHLDPSADTHRARGRGRLAREGAGGVGELVRSHVGVHIRPPAIAPAQEQPRLDRDRGQLGQGRQLRVVQARGEQHARHRRRGQHRGQDRLIGRPVHNEDAGGVGIAVGQPRQGADARRPARAGHDPAVEPHHHGQVGVRALAQVLQGRLGRGRVVGGHRRPEAEVLRQQHRGIVQLVGPQLPDAVEDHATGVQFLAHRAFGIVFDRREHRRHDGRDQEGEERKIGAGQLRAEMAKSGELQLPGADPESRTQEVDPTMQVERLPERVARP